MGQRNQRDVDVVLMEDDENVEQGQQGGTKPDLLDAAREWADRFGKDWGYEPASGIWRRWTGTHWQQEARCNPMFDAQVIDAIRTVGLRFSSTNQVNSVIRAAATLCTRLFPVDTSLVNFNNRTLDTMTMTTTEHNPDDGLTYCLPYWYTSGQHPTIDNFLEVTLPNPVAIDVYKTHIGLALIRDTQLHYACVLLGPPRSGKTTLLRLANAMCGLSDSSFAGPSLFSRETEGKRSRAKWNDRLVACVDELPVEALKDEEIFKIMVSHGGVEMRLIGKDEQTENQWRPKLLLATNETPRFRDLSGAMRERIIILEVPHRRGESDRDIHLLQRLLSERSMFAASCIVSAKEALRTGYYPQSESMRQALDTIVKQANPLQTFVAEYCILGADERVDNHRLYATYITFCRANGLKPLADNQLTTALVDMHIGVRPSQFRHGGKGVRGVYGLRLREPRDDTNGECD